MEDVHDYAFLSASVSNIKMIFVTHALPHPAQSVSNHWHIPCKKTFVIKLCVESFGKGEGFLFTKLLNAFILSSSFLLPWISLNCLFTSTYLHASSLGCQVLPGLARIVGVQSGGQETLLSMPIAFIIFLWLVVTNYFLQFCVSFCRLWLLRHNHLPQNMAYFSFLKS